MIKIKVSNAGDYDALLSSEDYKMLMVLKNYIYLQLYLGLHSFSFVFSQVKSNTCDKYC
jgi:hypothetical protein